MQQGSPFLGKQTAALSLQSCSDRKLSSITRNLYLLLIAIGKELFHLYSIFVPLFITGVVGSTIEEDNVGFGIKITFEFYCWMLFFWQFNRETILALCFSLTLIFFQIWPMTLEARLFHTQTKGLIFNKFLFSLMYFLRVLKVFLPTFNWCF